MAISSWPELMTVSIRSVFVEGTGNNDERAVNFLLELTCYCYIFIIISNIEGFMKACKI